MIAALQARAGHAHRGHAALRGVLLDAEGPHFSFGASVEEHLAERCAGMLASLHALILAMVEFPGAILVAVRGQCLGGGLEIALAGGPIFAAPDAQFGQPEMKLGVFAPAASVPAALAREPVWPPRTCCGRGAALGAARPRRSAWCMRWPMTRGRRAGLFRRAPGAARAPQRWPAPSKPCAHRACASCATPGRGRAPVSRRLMKTRDANEGLAPSSPARQPHWEHR
jgi:hypothetical protein